MANGDSYVLYIYTHIYIYLLEIALDIFFTRKNDLDLFSALKKTKRGAEAEIFLHLSGLKKNHHL